MERLDTAHSRLPKGSLWLGGTALLTAFLWLCDMASGVNLYDGAWFLHLLDGVSRGDALYADRFYGVLPLAVWAGVPGVIAVGSQIAVVKALYATSAAAAAVLAAFVARRLGIGLAGQALVVLASIAYLDAPSYSPYKQMAATFQIAAMAALVVWAQSAGPAAARTMLLLAGAAAGLSISSKHTFGAVTLVAVLAVVLICREGRDRRAGARLRDAGIVIVPAVAVPALTLLPVALAGDLGDFWRYAIVKSNYTEYASYSYLDEFEALGDHFGLPPPDWTLFLRHLGSLAAPLALVALLVAFRRKAEWLILASFTVAAIAGNWPRVALPLAIPVCSVAIAWSARELGAGLSSTLRRFALLGAASLLAVSVGLSLLQPGVRAVRDGYGISELEHHAGVPVEPELARAAGSVAGGLARVDQGEDSTLLLSPHASLLYLLSDLRSPTRHDYPLITTFRNGDLAELELSIRAGEIRRVCIGYQGTGRLRPAELESWVRSRLAKGERIAPPGGGPYEHLGCRVYRRSSSGE